MFETATQRSRNLDACDNSVCEAMVTHETSFFRNISAFDRLRDTVLPPLIENLRRRACVYGSGRRDVRNRAGGVFDRDALCSNTFPRCDLGMSKIVGQRSDLERRAPSCSQTRGVFPRARSFMEAYPMAYLKTLSSA